jgi:hypothetical protein
VSEAHVSVVFRSIAPLLPAVYRILPAILLLSVGLTACGPTAENDGDARPVSHLDSLPAAPAPSGGPEAPTKRVWGQTLYVPTYSHIYIRDAQQSMNLATTLSIRNTSPDASLTLSAVDYYDSNGRHVRTYSDTARTLGPLASTHVVVETSDIRGGVGANFLVRWEAETAISPPVVETVMITTESTQGISFRSTAHVLSEVRDAPGEADDSSSTDAMRSRKSRR